MIQLQKICPLYNFLTPVVVAVVAIAFGHLLAILGRSKKKKQEEKTRRRRGRLRRWAVQQKKIEILSRLCLSGWFLLDRFP